MTDFNSFVRGYHDYLAVLRKGHIPYNLAPTVELFLRREVNKECVEVNGARVNRGAGNGLELTDCMDLKYTVTN